MAKVRAILGLIAGALLILSSGAHSFLGWKGVNAELSSAGVPQDLVSGLKIGWHYGGVVMLALGMIVVVLFRKRLRGENVSTLPAVVIAIAYLAFGIWALVITGFNPFFFMFIIPGVLLAVASRPAGASASD